jgi:hypothetical protein
MRWLAETREAVQAPGRLQAVPGGALSRAHLGTSPAWNSDRLEYAFKVGGPGGQFRAEEYRGRGPDWYHFDAASVPAAASNGVAEPESGPDQRVCPGRTALDPVVASPRWLLFCLCTDDWESLAGNVLFLPDVRGGVVGEEPPSSGQPRQFRLADPQPNPHP